MGSFFSGQKISPIAAPPTIGSGTQQGVLQAILAGLGYGGPGQPISPYGNSNLSSVFANPFSSSTGGLGGGGGTADGGGGGSLPSSMSFMTQMAQGGGAATPVSALPAWQAMVAAQNRNLSEGMTNLEDQFNVSGGRFSTDFGNAATDYELQAKLGQNALLGQMQLPALLQSQQLSAGAGMALPSTMLSAGQAQFGDWLQQLGGLGGIANAYPPMYTPGYAPSGFSQLMGAAGSLGGLATGLGNLGWNPFGGGGSGSLPSIVSAMA